MSRKSHGTHFANSLRLVALFYKFPASSYTIPPAPGSVTITHCGVYAFSSAEPRPSAELVFIMTVKRMNDRMGPHGLVPTPLVFGAPPALPVNSRYPPLQNLSKSELQTVQSELAEIIDSQPIGRALSSPLPPYTGYLTSPVDRVQYCEKRSSHRWAPFSSGIRRK